MKILIALLFGSKMAIMRKIGNTGLIVWKTLWTVSPNKISRLSICNLDFSDYRKSTPDAGAHMETCGENQMASEGKFCHFDVNNIPSQCSAENHFGYQRGDPCVLIKLNKVSRVVKCFFVKIVFIVSLF